MDCIVVHGISLNQEVFKESTTSSVKLICIRLKSFESRLTIFLSYPFIQRARTRARSFQCLYNGRESNSMLQRQKSDYAREKNNFMFFCQANYEGGHT